MAAENEVSISTSAVRRGLVHLRDGRYDPDEMQAVLQKYIASLSGSSSRPTHIAPIKKPSLPKSRTKPRLSAISCYPPPSFPPKFPCSRLSSWEAYRESLSRGRRYCIVKLINSHSIERNHLINCSAFGEWG